VLKAFARVTIWSAIVFNIGVTASDIVRGQYRSGAWDLWNVVVLGSWVLLLTRVETWIDTMRADAATRLRMSELALQAMQEQMAAGRVSVNITSDEAERRH